MAERQVKGEPSPVPSSTAPNPPDRPANYHRATLIFRVAQWLARLILHFLFVIEVKGLENIPRQGGYTELFTQEVKDHPVPD